MESKNSKKVVLKVTVRALEVRTATASCIVKALANPALMTT